MLCGESAQERKLTIRKIMKIDFYGGYIKNGDYFYESLTVYINVSM